MPSSAAKSHRSGPGALDLLEDAVHVLRGASAGTLAWYYLTTLPFVLGLLFFWADLSRDPGAADYSAGAALGLALLFLVMKTGQSVFATRLRVGLGAGAGVAPAPWTLRRVGRVALVQAIIQPSGLLVLPVAALLTLPLGWACAFYGHANAVGDDAAGSPGHACVRAMRESSLWPRQNHIALLVISMLCVFVWVNVLAACALAPQLVKMFTGEENAFTRAGLNLFNSTFFAATGAIVYLALDPLWKAFYTLRAFHADAQRTGEDLQRALGVLPASSASGSSALGATAA